MYLDGPHTTETVSWMVTEAGCHNPQDDNGYCAGVIPQVGGNWQKVQFPEKMRNPVVFSQITSKDNALTMTLRQKGVNKKKFMVELQAEAQSVGNRVEKVSYIAFN